MISKRVNAFPRFHTLWLCVACAFFSVSQVGAALMGDTAGHKPREPTYTWRLNSISMYRGEVLRACFRHLLLCFHF